MIDLSTQFLGLTLKSPLVASSSPLTGALDSARRLEDAGAAALVLPSLFEERIQDEQKTLERFIHFQSLGHYESDSFHPIPDGYQSELDGYLENLQRIKTALGIPVIASLNGVSDSGWVEQGKELAAAGADALELNVYYVAADPAQSGRDVEMRYLHLLTRLREQVSLPIAMKLSSQFSSVAYMVGELERAGAAGAVLFNRFYQPDIDLDTLAIKPALALSSPTEALLRVRWLALLRGHTRLSLAATGGFHTSSDVIKALLAGADAVYLCSALLQQGPALLARLTHALHAWLEEREYASVRQMQGSLCQSNVADPAAYEHANYVQVIDSYSAAPGIKR